MCLNWNTIASARKFSTVVVVVGGDAKGGKRHHRAVLLSKLNCTTVELSSSLYCCPMSVGLGDKVTDTLPARLLAGWLMMFRATVCGRDIVYGIYIFTLFPSEFMTNGSAL